jgi:hypothetical protein
LPPIKFREDAYKKTLQSKLKIGYLCYKTSDGKTLYGLENLPISKATTRAVEMTIQKLKELGHTLVPFEIN